MPDDLKSASAMIFGVTGDCLPIDELVLLLEDEESSELRLRAQGHVAACLHCEAELALYRKFQMPEILPQERPHVEAIVARLRDNTPVPQNLPWWKALWNFKVLAPAALALAGLAAFLVWMPGTHAPNPDAFTGDDVLRSRRVEVISPVGTLSNIPDKLQWQSVKDATQYRVRLFEVDNTTLWEDVVRAPQTEITPDVRKKIVPFKTLEWEVTAISQAGAVIGDSGKQRFRLIAPSPH